jgi:rhodanese-related sulfurtransferase
LASSIAIARSRKTSFNETPAAAPAWAKIGAHTPKNQETPMPITKGFRQLVDEANAQITTYSVAQVRARLDDPKVQIVDIRDVRELEREGTVPGCINAPRGMLEFWVDPASPYYKPVFGDEGKEYILFCGAGWRSALAAKALKDMGMSNVAHIDGGFADWVKQAAPVESYEAHRARRHPAK